MSRSVKEILSDLAPSYDEWKGGEKGKTKFKDEFFEAAVGELGQGPLAEKVVEVKASDDVEAKQRVVQRYPMWIPDDMRPHPDREGYFEVIIREDPFYLTFSAEHDGRVWQRQVVSGSPMLDDERLQQEDPDLWREITEWPNQAFIEELLYNANVDGHEIDGTYSEDEEDEGVRWVERLWVFEVAQEFGIKRQMKDLDSLDPELLGRVQEYMYEGKPQIKLPAPKAVKSE